MAYAVMIYIVIAHVVMACAVLACIARAYTGMAYIVLATLVPINTGKRRHLAVCFDEQLSLLPDRPTEPNILP